ncbi:MAG TPA: amidohydrolase family protein [Acidimicrobiales bacterium]|nr:amidohydrolase family protein [Acidimicrobiales bacterium]
MTSRRLLLRGAEVGGELVDVSIGSDRIDEVAGVIVPAPADEVVECGAGALIPALYDHHLHLLSAAAAETSVNLAAPQVIDRAGLERALLAAAASRSVGSWIRAVGYHESAAGDLDRQELDRIVPDSPVRVQHRSGALWMLNSLGLASLGIQSDTGRLFGADETIRQRLQPAEPPALAALSARLAAYGVAGVTDATPSTEPSGIEMIGRAVTTGELRQRVAVMGASQLRAADPIAGVEWGPVKIVLADHDLPDPATVGEEISGAHRHGRPVAIHCVTAAALAIALAAWNEAGALDGDRVEHGSLISTAAADQLAQIGVTVVTQPGFVAQRGDDYLAEVDPHEVVDLYRCASLISHGVGVGGSSDAPFGELDPWLAVEAAVRRRTPSGAVLGGEERLDARRALDLFLTDLARPGGRRRRVAPLQRADLCLLDAPLAAVLADPGSHHVVATIAQGRVIFRR